MTEPPIDIEVVTYSPVGAHRPDRDFWVETIKGADLDPPVRKRVTTYIGRCYPPRDSDFHDVKFQTPSGEFLRDKLSRFLNLPLTEEGDRERGDITQELAARLSERMEASGAPTVPGAIFLIQAKIEGKRYVAIIKLDLDRQEVIALQRTTEAKHLFCKVFEDALPEDTKRFRKALILPGTQDGEARSGQFDAEADYWEEFTGAQPLREAIKAAKAILATTKRMMGKGLPYTDTVARTVLERSAALKERTTAAVAGVIKAATRSEKSADTIEQVLRHNLRRTTLNGIAPVTAHVYHLLDDLDLRVPAERLQKGDFSIKKEGEYVVIRVRGASLDRDDIVEHRP